MNKVKIANIISTLTNPPIICIPLFLIICIILSFKQGSFDLNHFIIIEIISIIFTSILPMAIILFWAKKLGTDKDISKRTDRFTPLITGIISYFIGFLITLTFNLDNFLTCLLLCYSINTGVVLLITTKWKISVHTTGLSGPIAALTILSGAYGAIFAILYPLVIWSRVILKKHTLTQAIAGGVQGFFLTVIEMHLFMNILNLPVSNITGFETTILYIISIIITPIILGILSYVKTKNPQKIFIITQIILLLAFLTLTPVNITLIYIIISISSIIISLIAGDEFIWCKILKNQSFNTL